MKFALFFAFVLSSLYTFTSCTKTNNITTTIRDTTLVRDTTVSRDTVYEKTPVTIAGLWTGTYINTGDVDSFYYSIAISSNGTCTSTAIGATSNAGGASGTWQLSGTAFTASVTALNYSAPELVQAITATYDSAAGTLKGQYTYTQGSGIPGTFRLTRAQ